MIPKMIESTIRSRPCARCGGIMRKRPLPQGQGHAKWDFPYMCDNCGAIGLA